MPLETFVQGEIGADGFLRTHTIKKYTHRETRAQRERGRQRYKKRVVKKTERQRDFSKYKSEIYEIGERKRVLKSRV